MRAVIARVGAEARLTAAVALVAAAAAGCAGAGSTGASARDAGTPATARPSSAPASASDLWRIVYRTRTRPTELIGIASISTTDAWAAGFTSNPHADPLVLHWNGKSWRPVRLPGARGFLPSQIMASGAGNVWLLGLNHAGGHRTMYRFDGDSWRTVPLPPGPWSNNLAAVTGRATAWLASGGCKASSWPWNCSSTIEQWTGLAGSPRM